MTQRRASCSCGQLSLICAGDPVRVSICHCRACQRRTGSAFAVQARFADAQIVDRTGSAHEFTRTGDSGGAATFRFCPVCGATVYWTADGLPGFTSIAVGAFADPQFPPPSVSVYEEFMHAWAMAPGALAMEHMD